MNDAVLAEIVRKRKERAAHDAEMGKGECVAKVKFWFGSNTPDIFNTEKYIVELEDNYAHIYKRVKPSEA